MKHNLLKYASILVIALVSSSCQDKQDEQETETILNAGSTLTNAQQVKNCSFSRSGKWWSRDYNSLPAYIAKNPVTGSPEFCEFYQFAEDWFLYLISPSAISDNQNWEDQTRFPLLETAGTNSCDDTAPKHALNIRTAKSSDDSQGFVLPERMDQAGAHAIYDQNGNVVLYEIRFSKNLCDYKAIQKQPNFPGKTLEMKISWRVLANTDDTNSYYTTTAIINKKNYKLGLIGWHIVVTADNHPEMVWITLEHQNNSVICNDTGANQPGRSFTSRACAQDTKKCNHLNESLASSAIKLPPKSPPYDICQAYPYGTLEGQSIETKDGLNIALVQKLNNELRNTILAESGIPASLAVWRNYQFNGALWISDIKQGSSVSSNQRGSLLLANSVMETTFQGKGNTKPMLNCFVCHNYNGTSSSNPGNTGDKNTGKNSISHIFDEIISGQQ